MSDETNEKSRGFEEAERSSDDKEEVEKIQDRRAQQRNYIK